MRIAQVAPLFEAVPPKTYGGTERVVSYITEALVDGGHDVTLFASGDSQTRAQLVSATRQAMRLDPDVRDTLAAHHAMIEDVCRRADEFDVIHCHIDYWPFSAMSRQPTPFVTTLHGRLDLPELQQVFDRFCQVPLVSISHAQRRPLSQANFVANVPHGLPIDLLRPTDATPEYLAFLGRVCPEKRPDLAIEIAQAAGMPLKIAAKVDRVDQEYFESVIWPLLHGSLIEFVGEITEAEKPAFLSGARALLLPIEWPEPFGLVMIEAMACGTPVVAFNRGSVPEVVTDGETGFIVDDAAGAIAALERLGRLSRQDVRAKFEKQFTSTRMAADYLSVFRALGQPQCGKLRIAG